MSKRFLLVFLMLVFGGLAKAQDLLISGGNNVSTIICSNGFVYTWGNNTAGSGASTVTGTLGNGSAAAFVPSPLQVTFPADPYFTSLGTGITVRAVDAGSGAHFIAVDCQGGAWSWGNNGGATGITGTGSTAAGTTAPARVLRGETPGGAAIHASLANFLVNVRYISGGNDNSYAILNNGEAVGWGRNNVGQVGDGFTIDRNAPRYIRTPDGQTLKNIIQIEAGDVSAYALVDDDGDGLGTVYSWGSGANGRLGRHPTNPTNSGNETGNDSWARPVRRLDGTVLDNIRIISAGDVMCFALDANGFVWAWGNGGWGDLTGVGVSGLTHSNPLRVVAGEWATTPGGNGQTHLIAKSISGGQGFGMAVSIDGIPLAWGNNNGCGSDGGKLGDGTNTTRGTPVIIRTGAATYHTNVNSISDGDTWGFYTTEENRIYTWGNNHRGQLGINNQVCQQYATEFTLPPCTFPAPKPYASITPRNLSVCVNGWAGQSLNSQFEISAALAPSYRITWFRNGTQVATGNGTTAKTYTATTIGTYRVRVEYIGSDAPCSPYTPAEDQIEITEAIAPYTAVAGTYCGANGTFSVTGYTGNTNQFDWYTTLSSTTKLNGATPSNTITTALTNATQVNATTYRLWAEDAFAVDARVVNPSPCAVGTGANLDPDRGLQRFTVTENITLKSVDVFLYNTGGTGSNNLQVLIYTDNAGNPTTTLAFPAGPVLTVDKPAANTFAAVTVPANINLTPGTYWLRVTSDGEVKNFTCWSYPHNDNSGKNILTLNRGYLDWVGNGTNYGVATNWNIVRGNYYACRRIPVDITQDCPPCQPPTSVSITSPSDPTTICLGSNLTIVGTANVSGLTPQLGGYYYQWFKGTTPIGTASTTYSNLTINNVTATDAATYKLRVEDGTAGTAACYREASVTINVQNPAAVPAPTVTNNCGSTVITPAAAPANVTYYWQSADGGTATTDAASGARTVTTAGTYYIRALNTVTNCWSTATTAVTVTINAVPADVPAPTVTNNCGSTDITPGAAPAGITYFWQTADGGTSTANAASGVRNVTTAGTYFLRAQNTTTGCWSVNTTAVNVTINAIPADVPTPTVVNNCGSTDITPGTPPTGITYFWQTASGGTSTANAANGTLTVTAAGTYYLRAQNTTTGCWSVNTRAVTVTINAIPADVPAPTTVNNCGNTDINPGTAPAGITYFWQSTDGGTSTATATSGVRNVTTAGTYFIRAQNTATSCWSVNTTSVNVTINAVPAAPTAITGASPACPSSNLTIGAAPTGVAYFWQGTNANGTSTASPATTAYNVTTSGTYYVRAQSTEGCWSATSTSIAIVINALNAGTVAGNQTVCEGVTPATITSSSGASGGNGAGSYVYEWEVSTDNSNWTGTGVSSLDFPFFGPITQTMYYRRKVTSGTCDNYTTVIIKTFSPLPAAAGTITGPVSVCVNQTGVTYSIAAVANASTYNWTVPSGATITAGTGTTSITVSFGAATTGDVSVTPSNSCGNGTNSQTSVTVNPILPVSVSISGSNEICIGEPATFTAVPVNGGTPSYQWTVNGSDVSGETGATFTSTALANNDVVRVRLTSSEGCTSGNPATSNAITMQVTTAVTPAVSINPSANPICDGQSVTLTAAPSNGGTAPTFQWYVNNNPVGTNSTTYTSSTLAQGDQVRVMMTSNSSCAITPTANSNVVSMTVNANVPVSVSINNPAAVCSGTSVTFNATGTNAGSSATYQWYVNGVPQGAASSNSNFTSSTLNNGDQVNVVMTSSLTCKTGSPATSNTHTMTVNPILNVTVNISAPSVAICPGVPITYNASSNHPGTTPVYQWSVNGVNQGGNSASFTSSTLSHNDIVRVVLTSSEQCKNQPTVSAQVNANIFTIPTVTVNPSGTSTICQGSSVQLTSSHSGVSYDWLKDGVSTGTNSMAFSATEAGNYQVVVNFPAGCAGTSAPVTVQVLPVPNPVILHNDTTICSGTSIPLTVLYDAGSTLQWHKNNALIAGATGAVLVVGETGIYTVTEHNGACPYTSQQVSVTVVPTPVAYAGKDITVLEGTTIQLNAMGGTNYQWSPSTGLSNPNVSDPLITPTDNMVLTVTVSNGNCQDTDELRIFVEKPIIIPNSFSPNGDNINDTWEIQYLTSFPECEIEIFNRWGTLVWKARGPIYWDGTNFRNDELLPVATYYYVITLNSEIFKKPYTGHVTIIR
ncbi:MAG: gliding motility-associated C-terminal domain-containing protein [Cytophagaceae bacterium]